MSKKIHNSILLTLSIVVSTLGGAPAWSASAPDGTLKIGLSAEFETLNPIISEQAATRYLLYMAWRPLVVLSLDNKWTPLLIKTLPTVENKLAKKVGEGIDVTIELLPEVKWGDGAPMTCKDVEFGWQVGRDPNVSNGDRDSYANIKSITWNEKTPKKCLISFIKAKYDYFVNFPFPLPEHLEGPVFAKHRSESLGYDHHTLYTKDPTNPGLYNGPFMIKEVKLGSHVLMVANPNFWGKKPSIQKVIFKLIPNGNVLTANLQAGDINMISNAAGLGLDQAISFEKEIAEKKLPYQVVFKPGLVYGHIDLNMDHPALADIRVRQALAMGFNKKEMLESLTEGRGEEADIFVPKSDPWYPKKITKYNFDRKKASMLLDQAGWKMGPNGIRTKDGKTLTLTLLGASGVKITDLIETYMQSQYKAIGVEIKIKNEPARVLFGETIKHRKFDMALYSWVALPENSPRTTMYSTQIPTQSNSWSGQNNPGYKNPEVDKLIDQLEAELSFKKRQALGQKMVELCAKDVPVIPLYYRPTNSVIPTTMKGFRLSGHLHYETLYVENWSF
jgi:peptide/nickel transport system substrate-binding protein